MWPVRPATTPHEIVLDCRAGVGDGDVLPWTDVLVGVRQGRVVLRSASLGRDIRPTAHHMLNPHGAPPVCQFLEDVSRSGAAALHSFDWGPASHCQCCRVSGPGRIVLAPARWLLPARLARPVNDQAADLATFETAVAEWRGKWDIPQRVYLSAGDNRLLLDLSRPDDVAQLRREAIKYQAPMRLEEAIPDVGDAWLPGPAGGYLAEVVVPLIRRAVPATMRTTPAKTAAVAEPNSNVLRTNLVVRADERRTLPGGEWLFAKLYGPRDTENDLLTGALADLCNMTDLSGLVDRWFFLRYADPDPHVRLRWHGEPDVLPRHVSATNRRHCRSATSER